ncbi:FMN-binding protein [Paenibacillus sp. CC-CFT747]|nr:FMN-binding protein [Paenibacillus sp. CC-CFT747]
MFRGSGSRLYGRLCRDGNGGFLQQPAAQQIQPSPQAQGSPSTGSGSTAGKSTKAGTIRNTYKDGTFTGMGSNRRGSIQVAVTIKNDKITDVEISRFAMHYSESDVVGLPGEVLQKQSAGVANVSGATYSTEAFRGAVQQALDQARNA